MKIDQYRYMPSHKWKLVTDQGVKDCAHLVFVFGNTDSVKQTDCYQGLKHLFPKAQIVISSSSGEISGDEVLTDSMVATAITFDHITIKTAEKTAKKTEESFDIGMTLAKQLHSDELRHIFVISDGIIINGSELVAGMKSAAPNVSITGGLAGDNDRFELTLVGINKTPTASNVIAIGFYGDALQVGYGSQGGWDTFGPERIITKSKGNRLYELDGKSAVELYKTYIGCDGELKPGEALFFPLSIVDPKNNQDLVRTVLAINEADGSMTFAGDMPEGASARLMKANFNRLIDGAADAATQSAHYHNGPVDLALLVSCVGRKLVLGQHVDDEVEDIMHKLSPNSVIAGFYSYGEICTSSEDGQPYLHNQTMTITTLSEASE